MGPPGHRRHGLHRGLGPDPAVPAAGLRDGRGGPAAGGAGAALERLTDKTARGGEESISVLRDLLLWWLTERVKSGVGAGQGAPPGLDRWARLWENTRRLFERADAASLDRKQALLEIFYDIQSTARAA